MDTVISPISAGRLGTHPSPLDRVRALVLLGGVMRPTKLSVSIGRPVLELPLETGRSLLGHWVYCGSGFATHVGLDLLQLHVLVDKGSPDLAEPKRGDRVEVSIQRDSLEYRGTGGLLRDVAQQWDDDDFVLVSNAAYLLLQPLADLARSLAVSGSDVSLIAHGDATPGGLMLVRCGALRRIPCEGFIDMKEQALPQIARSHDVRVVHWQRATGMPIRTLEDYISAVRAHHGGAGRGDKLADPFMEDWRPSFRIVEEGAEVDSASQVHD